MENIKIISNNPNRSDKVLESLWIHFVYNNGLLERRNRVKKVLHGLIDGGEDNLQGWLNRICIYFYVLFVV